MTAQNPASQLAGTVSKRAFAFVDGDTPRRPWKSLAGGLYSGQELCTDREMIQNVLTRVRQDSRPTPDPQHEGSRGMPELLTVSVTYLLEGGRVGLDRGGFTPVGRLDAEKVTLAVKRSSGDVVIVLVRCFPARRSGVG